MANFIETRGMLAKLLATENLIIEHDRTATTASFDTENRVLKLPVLKTENESIYNMFCAHEVGHALQTPSDWNKQAPDGVPFDFINVVEDVRIERYIQNKFPGLRSDFSKGYDKLNEDDFFQLKEQDISKMSLIDRINLHFKLGARAMITFSTEEMVYVNAVDQADTWQKVLLAATMIRDYVGTPKDKNEDIPSDINTETQGQGNQQSSNVNGNSESDQSDDQKGDDGEELDNEGDDITQDQVNPEMTSETQRAFDESMSKLSDNSAYSEYVYAEVGDINLDDIIVSINTIRESIIPPTDPHNVALSDQQYKFNQFLNSIRGDVNHMVQQFEMKKSADSYSRQQVHKTGVLDTNRLHNYKLTDDIFMRQSITPEGKCHGMVMYLDWSGSMSDICFDTVKQIITLVQFCRKVQIPFDVYLFTSPRTQANDHASSKVFSNRIISHESAGIYHILTSNSKKKQIDNDMFNLWCASVLINGNYYQSHSLPCSPYYAMGGTPLNNALIIIPELIKEFREKTGAQKVSFVCITDGESAPLQYWTKVKRHDKELNRTSYCYYETLMLRKGSSVFPIEPRSTGDIVNWLKTQLTDVYISNIFLGKYAKSASHLNSYETKINEKLFRKNGSYVTTSKSWPIIGVVNPTSFNDATSEIDIEAGQSKAKIKSAFNKMLKTKQSSRIILTELANQFA